MFKNAVIKHKRLTGFVATLIISALIPLFVHSPYYLDLLIMIIINAILAMTFIMMLKTGLLSLGIAAFWGVGSYASAVLAVKMHLPFWLCLPAASLIAGVIAWAIGYFVIGRAGTGFTFVILSAVMGMLFRVVVGSISYVGGYYGMGDIPAPNTISLPFLPEIVFDSKMPFFYLALFLLVVVVLILNALYSGWAGRAWKSIGMNPRLAESLGINIFRYKMFAFILASAIAGLAGSFYAHYRGYIMPDTYNMWVNIYIQIYAILGGIDYAITGPLVGSAVMTFFPEFLRTTREIAPIYMGALLVLLILFQPSGLLGLWDKRRVLSKALTGIAKKIKYARQDRDMLV
jgi:branched-chain amino acid transport system permease protein